jgi:hypothetical protein
VTHLGDRIGALADGELDHRARDRALAHVAHGDDCRAALEAQRAVKERLGSAAVPAPDAATMAALHALASPGGPLPPRSRTMPLGVLVPDLPPPGRRPRGVLRDSRRPGHVARRRAGVVGAGALSLAGLVLGTAFVAGGAQQPAGVVPPAAELTVEHGRTAGAVTVGDPSLGLMTTFDTTLAPRR